MEAKQQGLKAHFLKVKKNLLPRFYNAKHKKQCKRRAMEWKKKLQMFFKTYLDLSTMFLEHYVMSETLQKTYNSQTRPSNIKNCGKAVQRIAKKRDSKINNRCIFLKSLTYFNLRARFLEC